MSVNKGKAKGDKTVQQYPHSGSAIVHDDERKFRNSQREGSGTFDEQEYLEEQFNEALAPVDAIRVRKNRYKPDFGNEPDIPQ